MHININTLEKSRTARSDKNTNSCPKTCNKTVSGYIFYHTSKILQTRKLEKSIISVLSHYFKDAKFTVDGSCVVTVLCAAEQVALSSSSLSGGSCWQCFRSRDGAHARTRRRPIPRTSRCAECVVRRHGAHL